MADQKITRREFLKESTMFAAAISAGWILSPGQVHAKIDTGQILNYNPDMEYRRCGRTGLMISAAALGGHWKRVVKVIGGTEPEGWMTMDIHQAAFQKNRHEVVTRCIDRGFNYVDACCREEILAYSKALKGRRDKMYLGYSWHIRESRFKEWRSLEALKKGFDDGMKEADLDYVDIWRISLLVDSHQHTEPELESAMRALEWAKKTGR
ncbi:MAG: hypothetical protein GY809_11665, partial [Planctomycetes bacterium]|nr:hypothetical protein [Planctomycetota bacterium]